MKRAVAIACFGYGVLGSFAALAWYSAILRGGGDFPDSTLAIEGIWASYGLVFLATSLSRPSAPLFEPLFRITPLRAVVARRSIIAAVLNVLAWLTAQFIARVTLADPYSSWRLLGLMAAVALLSTTYFTFHWAYRPENFLSGRVLRFFYSPMHYAFSWKYRKGSRDYPRRRG